MIFGGVSITSVRGCLPGRSSASSPTGGPRATEAPRGGLARQAMAVAARARIEAPNTTACRTF
jgi:hypothetical protein